MASAATSSRFERAFDFLSQSKLQYLRHLVQLACLVVLNGKLFGLSATRLIVPYLHVTQSPWSTAHGAYESLEYTIARGVFPLLVLGVIYFTAITVGRVFCGWACPMGFVQDLLSYLPIKKRRFSASVNANFKDLKWVVVGFSVLVATLVGFRRAAGIAGDDDQPAGVFSDSPFSVFSPAGTLFAYIPWLVMWKANVLLTAGAIGWLKIMALLGVIASSVYYPRFFCRFVCPMGALYEPVQRWKMLRITRSPKLANDDLNRLLHDVCPMDVQVTSNADFIDSGLCVHCGKCVTENPKLLGQSFDCC